MNQFSVIGSGFSGMSAACFLAAKGAQVTILEKNETSGGRARSFSEQGFTFDMGPSWYWMPDIFEKFFANFGKHPSDYYDLVRLDPGFQVIYGPSDILKVPATLEGIYETFEQYESGAAAQLKKFLADGAYKYKVGMNALVYRPAFSWLEFATPEVIAGLFRLHMFRPMNSLTRQYFKDERLRMLMEFPVLFLGATAGRIPALYSLMNYAAFNLGTWYPMGGMVRIGDAMETLARSLGVEFRFSTEVTGFQYVHNRVNNITTTAGNHATDGIIASGDYHYIEQHLLAPEYRTYTQDYWNKRVMAPSSLLFYLGVNKKVEKLEHHNLFFDASLDKHADEIYTNPAWPSDPLFYVCCPSATDPSVAPAGMENLFILMPLAPGLEDTPALRDEYFSRIMKRMKHLLGQDIEPHIVYKRSYCVNDFKADYHAFKGNAYGLANTLSQTAVLKPSLRNSKLRNLFYAGQLTVPGPGVPPALISGELAAKQLLKHANR